MGTNLILVWYMKENDQDSIKLKKKKKKNRKNGCASLDGGGREREL